VGMDPYVEVLDVRFVYEPLLSEPRTLIRIDVGRPPRGVDRGVTMTSIHPELWVGAPRQARPFHEAAFGAEVVHLVGEDDDIVAQLAVGDAMFLIAPASSMMKRLDPVAIDGATGRVLLVVDDADGVQRRAGGGWPWRRHLSQKSTGGGWVGSSTRSATSGRSGGHMGRGRPRAPARKLPDALSVRLSTYCARVRPAAAARPPP
jgi:hypothetical protein